MLPVLACAAALAVIVAASGFYLVAGYKSETIAQGVSVRGVDLGGMMASEAKAALAPAVEGLESDEITLTHGDDRWQVTRGELGLTVDLDATIQSALEVGHRGGLIEAWRARRSAAREGVRVPVATLVREATLTSALHRLAGDLEREPEPASVEFDRETHAVSVDPGVVGRQLDVSETRDRLVNSVDDLGMANIPLAVEVSYAEPRYEDLSHINAVLGAFSTSYSMGEANRSHNIALAAGALDEAFIEPGATLSYNETVGERTAEGGYKLAHVYIDGEIEDDIGGGICQVSSTLYNAALVAGLEIVSRRPHMMPVAYLDTGRDATVDWGSGIDLVIKNNTPHRIQLRTFAGDGQVSCLFLGAAEDKPEKVEIVRSGVSVTEFEVVEVLDPEMEPGAQEVEQEGRRGFTATVHRIIKRPGQPEQREWLSSDRYAMRNEIVKIGPPAEDLPMPGDEIVPPIDARPPADRPEPAELEAMDPASVDGTPGPDSEGDDTVEPVGEPGGEPQGLADNQILRRPGG